MATYSLKSIFSKIGRIGSHPDDGDEVKLQKTLLVAYTGSMAVMAFFWGLLYFYFEEFVSGSIPFLYAIISLTGMAIFARTKSFSSFLKSQLAFSLVLPFLLMISLGGFASSSAVIMWSLTSPLGALVLKGRKEALGWFLAFIGLLLISMYLEGKTPFSSDLPENIIIVFFAMNIIGTSLTSFIILRHFVGEKNLAMTLLESKNKWIKDAFSAYVSPNLVDHLLKNPEELKLGGERRECTFVFTDLVGFTPLIEKSDPETLVADLNEYFEGMINIVFKHEGTVSKIVGDAITVMFSAPVIQEDHAQRAVACALEMDAYAQNFAAEKQKKGIDMGRTRIGVNTGNVIIGNMGSKNQLDYRALGDAINTAARLESANKQLGTRVCVSETTVAQCPDFHGRPIGSLLLKGKTKPVGTFEPLTHDQLNSNGAVDYLSAFKSMEASSQNAIADFESLVEKYPEDSLAKYHLNRLHSGQSGATIILPLK